MNPQLRDNPDDHSNIVWIPVNAAERQQKIDMLEFKKRLLGLLLVVGITMVGTGAFTQTCDEESDSRIGQLATIALVVGGVGCVALSYGGSASANAEISQHQKIIDLAQSTQ